MTTIDLSSPIPAEPGLCRTCGTQLNGSFCVNCGEKAYEPGEHSIKHFFGDVLNAITFVDGKFLRTFKLMITKPGFMSHQYINGRRVPFIKPMSMFFIVNLIYFWFPLYNGLNVNLSVQMNNLPHSAIVRKMVEKKVKEEKTTFNAFAQLYDQQSTNMAKIFLVLIVIYFSVPLWLINYNKKLFYFDHLSISLELVSTAVLATFIVLGWLFYLIFKIGSLFGADLLFVMEDDVITPISMILILYLSYLFERNAYGQTVFRSITKGALLLLVFAVSFQLYRASLFFITIWTM